MRKQLGFTLLELLVVISIIGILLAMGVAAFTTAQRKARDSRRRSDITQIGKAFEQYYADDNGSGQPRSSYGADCTTMATSEYLPQGMPVGPQGEAYTCASATTGFCACAELEDTGSGNGNGVVGTACDFSAAGTHFCIQNSQ